MTASAGNHAQGVAMGAERLKIEATIVMPRTTPSIKVQAVRSLGGKAVLHGDSYDEAYAHALTLAAERSLAFIHPFDDPDVIAGQGTIGMEILRQHPAPPHAIFVPVGGGGLIAGVAAYVKYVRPEVRIIGVEPEDAPTLERAMAAGRRVELDQVGLFADGVAVRQIGKETFRLAKDLVDEVILVSTDEICAAIKDIFDDTRGIAEPAGALAVAGLKRYVEREGISGADLIAIESGANINFDRLRHVAERAELGERREALLAVQIPERPGSFLAFCRTLGKRQITEFNYRYADSGQAQVFVGVELGRGDEERRELIARLEEKAFGVVDMSDNETAKLHIRFMVGGHTRGVTDEMLDPLRVSRAARGTARLPERHRQALEHQPVPLPQPRGSLWAGVVGYSGPRGGVRRTVRLARPARVPILAGDGQSGLPDLCRGRRGLVQPRLDGLTIRG